MDERELLACIDGVGHGCEIVQSLFPEWRVRAADTVAAFALHGRYLHGPLTTIGPNDREDWLSRLSAFEMVLSCNDREIDRGSAATVLGGPLSALRHFVRGLSECPLPIGLRAGDLVTTGTVTRAFPVQPGERWSTQVVGLPLPGMHLLFT
jgi:2-oxo-3-hexenedioate decarboxylase